jgi:hypothetical protein
VAVPDLPAPRPRQAFEPVECRAYVAPRRGLHFKPTRAEAFMLKRVALVKHAREGDRHITTIRQAACLFGLAKGGMLDEREVAARIRKAAIDNGLDRENQREVDDALLWAWEHSQPWRLRG